jgi:hypothetical protein
MFMSKNKRGFAVRVANSCLLANDVNSLLRPQGNGYDTAF